MAEPQMRDPPSVGMGKVTWISFTSTKEVANDVKGFGTLFKNTDDGVVYHSILVDPRYDPSDVYNYLAELGATMVDLSTPPYD